MGDSPMDEQPSSFRGHDMRVVDTMSVTRVPTTLCAGRDICINANRPSSEASYPSATRPVVANSPSPYHHWGDSGSTSSFNQLPWPSGPLETEQNFHMRDLRYTSIGVANNVTVNTQPAMRPWIDGWERLLAHAAPNALHDSNARYDPPKCDEDTRVEVIRELTNWIEDRESPQRLLCMTGAAGSGKSALQQTMAEYCSKSNILGSAYFFAAADPTRNTTSSLIPTVAYQLGQRNPGLKEYIGSAVEEDELIFSKSLLSQMNALICNPVRRLRASGKLDLASFRYVILIDGLDECKGEDRQAEILKAVQECLLDEDLPFRIFISSRPEWAIHSALEPGGELNELAYHIQLSDQYDATADIRRYLQRSFRELGLRSRDPRARSPGWFSKEDIERHPYYRSSVPCAVTSRLVYRKSHSHLPHIS
ncbi:hypothetical protein EST38_g6629 [Candolleomyces aberdarensis]|uniref:Nephrocystin 3-like N-terminal domain-containing protein n=1 Tax=Candolleomyces aberdarensis TaxID=2316362 RepID=A0A4Q2DK49_9AGAR|nr:hypothetical protein EST38_g6629 [Candolleomyces aberdarensis]